MAIPEFDLIKAPALQLMADGQARRIPEIETVLADHFQLSPEARAEILPSGAERRWHNRVSWACYDLFRAGLFERVKRGTYSITAEGKGVAAKKPELIDREFLMQFPQFSAWISNANKQKSSEDDSAATPILQAADQQTPEEVIDGANNTIRAKLISDVLEYLRNVDAYRFEQIVLDVLLAIGYGGSREEAASLTKASHDEGIDGVINEDRLGLDVIYVQAKRWKAELTIGRKEIQSFVGALAGKQASKGIFITTSSFADTAVYYVKHLPQKVVLIDGFRLSELMVEHNIGVSVKKSYEIKQIDSDYFEG